MIVVNCFQKFISLIFETTYVMMLSGQKQVVNCFQKFISLIFETTSLPVWANPLALWIAFKSLYLWYSKQPRNNDITFTAGCELLSKVYIFDIRNNLGRKKPLFGYVVNCFQKFISLIFETTTSSANSLSLGCELLSKVYIFDIRNNNHLTLNLIYLVVNCFQKFISLIFETTQKIRMNRATGCELLSKVYIFDIRNNLEK